MFACPPVASAWGTEVMASLSVNTEMLSNKHLVGTCPEKENKFPVGASSGTGALASVQPLSHVPSLKDCDNVPLLGFNF